MWDINLLQSAAFQFILLKKAGKPLPEPPNPQEPKPTNHYPRNSIFNMKICDFIKD